jgi:hypothetical protein
LHPCDEQFLPVLVAICAALSSPRIRADDSEQLARALDFSWKFMFEHHLLAEVYSESREPGGPKEQFTYDRYPDVERIKLKEGEVFVKKKRRRWLKSNDWAETGTLVSSKKAADLDYDAQIAQIAWNPNHSSKDKSQGANVTKIVSRSNDKMGEHLVFECTREHPTNISYPRYSFTRYENIPGDEPLLEQFSGPILMGDQKMFITVRYTALIELKNARVKIIKGPTGKQLSQRKKAKGSLRKSPSYLVSASPIPWAA